MRSKYSNLLRLLILCIATIECGNAFDCKTFKNKNIQLDVADVRVTYNTTRLNLINIKPTHNYVSVKSSVGILCRKFLKKLNAVEFLWISGVGLNEIETNSFVDLKKLKSLNIFNNTFNNIKTKTFTKLQYLRYISLTNNEITTIGKSAFDTLSSLEELNLSSNKISAIQSDWLINCKKLIKLNLSKNNLKIITSDLLKNMNTFQWISVSFAFNKIEKINNEAFSKLLYVQELSLRNNSIKELPGDFVRNVKHGQMLDVNENKLNCISKDVIGKFKVVYVINNPLLKDCVNRLELMLKHYRMAIY